MVQMFTSLPSQQWAQAAEGIGEGIAKRLGLAEAQREFRAAEGDPLKLATAMARLTSVSPELARGAGPMYEAMLRAQQGQAMGAGMEGQQMQKFPYPVEEPPVGKEGEGQPSVTQPSDLEIIQKGYHPLTQQEIINRAGQKYNANPARYRGDPQNAIEDVKLEMAQQKEIYDAALNRSQNLSTIQDNLQNKLQDFSKGLGVEIPADIYSKIEDRAIQSVKPKEEGGEGLTVEQAMKKYGQELNEVSRQYKDIDGLSSWSLLTNPKETKSTMRNLTNEFRERGDLRNLADTYVNKFKISWPEAYSLADPLEDHKNLYSYVKNLEDQFPSSPSSRRVQTEKILPEIGKRIGKASPLSLMTELRDKGYDTDVVKTYLQKNKDKLGLTDFQVSQLTKTSPIIPTFNDIWLKINRGNF